MIYLELVIVEPIYLQLDIAPSLYIGTEQAGPRGVKGDTGDSRITIAEGAKYSATDAGTFGEVSADDDYLYICVKTGTAGNAIWKRTVLFFS